MQLNEIIEENSITTISKRTRISVENIERLVQRDFSEMKRVKALGFISILEREFGIKLDTLKKECEAYFASSPEEEFDARLVVTIPESGEESSGWISKLLVVLVLFGVGYGAWYFLIDKGNSSENNVTMTGSSSFMGTIVNRAKAWMGESSTLESDGSPAPADGVWAKTEAEQNSTGEDAAKAQSIGGKAANEKNDSATEEQIIQEVKQEQKELLAQTAANTDDTLSDADMAVEKMDAAADDRPAEEALATEVPSMAETAPAEATTAMEKVLPPAVKPKPNPKPKAVKKAAKKAAKEAGVIQIVTLHPTQKVWVGYTDLNTMKRAAKVIEEDIDFDTSASRWILVAGHNAINFVIKGKTITPKKRDKNYFLIEKGKVKEISKETFQKLNKSTVW